MNMVLLLGCVTAVACIVALVLYGYSSHLDREPASSVSAAMAMLFMMAAIGCFIANVIEGMGGVQP